MSTKACPSDGIKKWVAEQQGKHLCHCGCGRSIVITMCHRGNGIPLYLNHHHRHGPPPRLSLEERLLERVCPNCRKPIVYKDSYWRRLADKCGYLCKSCTFLGQRNPFFGRTHSQETKKTIGRQSRGRYFSPEARSKISAAHLGRLRPREVTEKMRSTKERNGSNARLMVLFRGEGNPFYGRIHTPETRQKIALAQTGRKASDGAKRKMSAAHRGRLNASYGKKAPIGSSTGIGGWFGGCHFRSSPELAFLLTHQAIKWVSAEKTKFSTDYVGDREQERTYFPDFFGQGFLVEVKASGWDRDPRNHNVFRKLLAAKRLCLQKGWELVLVEMPCIPIKRVFSLRESGVIRLDHKWERRFSAWKVRGKRS